MGRPTVRYVCRAIAGEGWRIWDRRQKKWWGTVYYRFPQAVLDALNGEKRPEELVRLTKKKNVSGYQRGGN